MDEIPNNWIYGMKNNAKLYKDEWKHWKSFDLLKYKGLHLRVPKYSRQYLEFLYGKSWRKKAEFWSPSNKR